MPKPLKNTLCAWHFFAPQNWLLAVISLLVRHSIRVQRHATACISNDEAKNTDTQQPLVECKTYHVANNTQAPFEASMRSYKYPVPVENREKILRACLLTLLYGREIRLRCYSCS